MKKSVKALLTVLCAIVLVVATVMGTLAYMTSRDTVVNTFTVGNVNITVDETDVDLYGQKDGENRVKANNYKLIPGKEYIKDPTMTIVADSEESYVRMLVTINCIDVFEKATGVTFYPENYVSGWDRDIWECVDIKDVNGDGKVKTYEFRYKDTVNTVGEDALVLDALFTTFTAPTELTSEHLAELDSFEIKVEGHAIQAATFEADSENNLTAEDVAWNAFDLQNAANP